MIQRSTKRTKKKTQAKITPELVQEIERLLHEEKASVNSIVKKFGVGWETAASIRDGLHRFQQPLELVYVRCRGCGGMVLLPCRACQLQR